VAAAPKGWVHSKRKSPDRLRPGTADPTLFSLPGVLFSKERPCLRDGQLGGDKHNLIDPPKPSLPEVAWDGLPGAAAVPAAGRLGEKRERSAKGSRGGLLAPVPRARKNVVRRREGTWS
jgi:hypothetical protein